MSEWNKNLAQQLRRQLEVSAGILDRATKTAHYATLKDEDVALVDRWLNLTSVVLRDGLGRHEERAFSSVTGKSYNGSYQGPFERCQRGHAYLDRLLRVVTEFPDQLTFMPPATTLMKANSPKSVTKNHGTGVFLIHGHDELNLLRLEKLVRERWNLKPIVLSEQAAKGRTIIEKFEQEAIGAGFALALLTPDDSVQTGKNTYAQARPNVVFELGWFAGRLGRSQIAILMQEGTRIHSDLDGINRIQFKTSVAEIVASIEQELKAAGLLDQQATLAQ